MLVASLALAGRVADAREMLQRYLALPARAANSITNLGTVSPTTVPSYTKSTTASIRDRVLLGEGQYRLNARYWRNLGTILE
jgi:hypothetical protein